MIRPNIKVWSKGINPTCRLHSVPHFSSRKPKRLIIILYFLDGRWKLWRYNRQEMLEDKKCPCVWVITISAEQESFCKEMMWNETIWLIFYRFEVLCSWASESKSEDTFSRPTFYALQHSFSDGYSEVPNRHDIGMFFCTQKGEQTTRSSNIPARWRCVDVAGQTKYISQEESYQSTAGRCIRYYTHWMELDGNMKQSYW